MTSVLIVKKPWIDLIVSGDKTMEVRGGRTKKVGQTIMLMASKTDYIIATAKIVDCIGPMDKELFETYRPFHKSTDCNPPYETTYGWLLADVQRLDEPIYHKRKHGSIVFSIYDP